MKSMFSIVPEVFTQSPEGLMWTVNSMSGHGTIFAYQSVLTPTVFTDVAELGDITPPALSRNEFDSTTQNEDIDSYVLGVLRRGAMTMPINYIPTEPTQDHITGLQSLIIDNTVTGFRVTFPDGTAWIMSGRVQNFVPHAPNDGLMSADVTIRFSGAMKIGTRTIS
jgi:hypothetical protein